MPLDWGALIPLWFMRAPAVVVSPSAPPRTRSMCAGAALARATGDRRVALIASADHGHGHTRTGPYGFAAESAPYDARIVSSCAATARRAARLDPTAVAAKPPTASGSS
jgi:aromatic ring-opening dioxygenase LigB subunit